MSDSALTIKPYFSLTPKSLEEAISFAKLIADSDLAPKDYRGKPGNVLIAVQMGAEVGLSPMQAIQTIGVINGRPGLFGDGLLAVVQASSVYEAHEEPTVTGEGDAARAVCRVKRRGQEWSEYTFSVADAKRAGLWGKQGPWTQYPLRMLKMRARGFALRDAFADVIKGLKTVEELQDTPADAVVEAPPSRPALMAPQRKSEVPFTPPEPRVVVELTAEPADPPTAHITEEQRIAFYAAAKKAGFKSREAVQEWLLATTGIEDSAHITAQDYDDLMAAVEQGPRS